MGYHFLLPLIKIWSSPNLSSHEPFHRSNHSISSLKMDFKNPIILNPLKNLK